MAKLNFSAFVRECYLRSTPSVDLNNVTSDNPIDCCKHTLSVSEYEKILSEFDVQPNTDTYCACNMWLLQSGPNLTRN